MDYIERFTGSESVDSEVLTALNVDAIPENASDRMATDSYTLSKLWLSVVIG